MAQGHSLHVVIDTNVLFEGLTQTGGASGLVIDSWLAGLFQAHVSNALAYEYVEVLSRKLATWRWRQLQPVLEALLRRAKFVPVYFSWRPMSADPGDEHVIDCAMNAGAAVVTWNTRDYRMAQQSLGLVLYTPVELVAKLSKEAR